MENNTESIDQIKTILNDIRAYLKTSKAEVYNHLKDPKVSGWKQLDPHRYETILQELNISADKIAKSLLNYPKVAKEISKQITLWDNEIGNQLADLIGDINIEKSLAAADAVKKKSTSLEKLKENMYAYTQVLIEADQTLRASLGIKAMVPLARKTASSQKRLFNNGLKVFRLVSNALSEDEDFKNMNDFFEQSSKMETRFQHIDIPRFPRVAEEILYHYVEIGSSANAEIHKFTTALNSKVESELRTADTINIALGALTDEPIVKILKQIPTHAKALGNLISGFYHKKKILGHLEAIEESLEILNIYHIVLKNNIITTVVSEIENQESTIAPVNIAEKMTKDFFDGAKGIIRSFKLMVSSLKGKPSITEVDLQLILVKAITDCKVYFSKSAEDIKKMTAFFDSLLSEYNKPFPYNDLFQMCKTTVSKYGQFLEEYIKKFSIGSDIRSLSTVKIPSTFGALAQKVKERKALFQVANKEG